MEKLIALARLVSYVGYKIPRAQHLREGEKEFHDRAAVEKLARGIGREVLRRHPASLYVSPGQDRLPSYVESYVTQIAESHLYIFSEKELTELIERVKEEAIMFTVEPPAGPIRP